MSNIWRFDENKKNILKSHVWKYNSIEIGLIDKKGVRVGYMKMCFGCYMSSTWVSKSSGNIYLMSSHEWMDLGAYYLV